MNQKDLSNYVDKSGRFALISTVILGLVSYNEGNGVPLVLATIGSCLCYLSNWLLMGNIKPWDFRTAIACFLFVASSIVGSLWTLNK